MLFVLKEHGAKLVPKQQSKPAPHSSPPGFPFFAPKITTITADPITNNPPNNETQVIAGIPHAPSGLPFHPEAAHAAPKAPAYQRPPARFRALCPRRARFPPPITAPVRSIVVIETEPRQDRRRLPSPAWAGTPASRTTRCPRRTGTTQARASNRVIHPASPRTMMFQASNLMFHAPNMKLHGPNIIFHAPNIAVKA